MYVIDNKIPYSIILSDDIILLITKMIYFRRYYCVLVWLEYFFTIRMLGMLQDRNDFRFLKKGSFGICHIDYCRESDG